MNTGEMVTLTRRVSQAVLTNQVARLAPRLYVRLTGQTGRGGDEVRLDEVGGYFEQCVSDYLDKLKATLGVGPDFFAGKRILEYGPGDLPGVAMLLIANGAERVVCVDRFPLVNLSPKNLGIARLLLDRQTDEKREKMGQCFMQPDRVDSGFREEKIEYLIRPNGLSHLENEVDVVMSRAVLEHVNDLGATFRDMQVALRPGGIAIHQVDLKSHGLHRHNPLDFLTWPSWLWSLMYSSKGVPNRWRVNAYRDAIAQAGLETLLLHPTLLADEQDVAAVRPNLATPFAGLSNEDLSWLGFWLVCRKPAVS